MCEDKINNSEVYSNLEDKRGRGEYLYTEIKTNSDL